MVPQHSWRRLAREVVRTTVVSTVGWTLAALLFAVIRFVGIRDADAFRDVDLSPLQIGPAVGWVLLSGAVFGFLTGLFEPALARPAVRELPYGVLIGLQAAYRAVLIVLVMGGVAAVRDDAATSAAAVVQTLASANTLVAVLYVSLVSCAFAFVMHVDRKFGPGNLLKLLLGRYYRPREERRVFLFVDLQSSTTLAEQLGHVRYSRLIQDCFRDLAVVIEDDAEVYQYVGDEAVLSWREAPGLRDAACIRAFFRFDDQIRSRAAWYTEQYGVVPVFKAGGNVGLVTVAEVGEIKREIAFHGDVLNTAARIQSRSNEYGRRMLISQYLLDALGPLAGYKTERLGNVALKGRSETVDIWAVDPQ